MRYVEARCEQHNRESTYRIYTAEMLRYMAKSWGYDVISYLDILHPEPEETRTADEIIAHMKKKIGGEQP